MTLGKGTMTSKERVRSTFGHKEPDRVPIFEQVIASNVASEILGKDADTGGGILRRNEAEARLNGEGDAFVSKVLEDIVKINTELDLDVVKLPWLLYVTPKKKLDENTYYYEDEKTGLWEIMRYSPDSMTMQIIDSKIRREGLHAIEILVKNAEVSSELPVVRSQKQSFRNLDYIITKLGKCKCIAGSGTVGIPMNEPWLEALLLRPDLIERYLDYQLEHTLESIRLQAKYGVDFINGGTDLATNKGPIYSPKLFRRFILPRLRKLTKLCHELGLPYIYRTDGNTWPIAQELFIESGVDGYGEIDAQAGMDIGELKTRLPNLTLWGNVDCAKTLVYGTKEMIINETKNCIKKGAPGGGYIFGSSNTIHPKVPTQNFMIMLETARKYGEYP